MTKKINIGEPNGEPTSFAKIVSEIKATRIPSSYIDKIVLTYLDGSVVVLSGDEITHPIPLDQPENLEKVHKRYKNVQEVKVFVKLEKLEHDINTMIMDKLGKYFQQ